MSGRGAVGAPLDRVEGHLKVRGAATYANEWPVENPAYLYPLLSTIASGRVTGVDTSAAMAEPGVLGVLTHLNAPKLAWPNDPEVAALQSGEVAFHGQFVGAVVAESIEIARYAAGLVTLKYEKRPVDVDMRADRDDLLKPQHAAIFGSQPGDLQDGSPADSAVGDFEAGMDSAIHTLDATYSTPIQHHHPLEPHTSIAVWTDDEITLRCSSQGVHLHRMLLANAFGIDASRIRVISPHVGGAFGSKVFPVTWATLALMGAQLVPGRPVKFALTRQQMFTLVGHRPATIQRIRLGADADGRLVALGHDVVQETAKAKQYAEQTVAASRLMYAAPHRRTTTRIATLDLPVPTIMRGPGEATGMFALESAMDEFAVSMGMDPIEFRVLNEPEVHPESGLPFSSRHLVTCLREGSRRFGWEHRAPATPARRENGWLIGTGVASSTYPSPRLPGNTATIRVGADGRHTVRIAAADIGTGTWTTLTQIAAEALDVAVEDVTLRIGDTDHPLASSAGFSSGINCWGTTIHAAADELRAALNENGGRVPDEGLEVTTDIPDNPYMLQYAMYSFGAQFAEVRVHEDTGEVRVPRLLGVFDVGRVINPKTARSQLLGGMTQGLSMALHEAAAIDPRYGHVVNNDLGGYHFASNADVGSIEVHCLEERDPYTNPMGSKGAGEVCIVGTAAAIANAVYHATGIRVRDLPITLDKLLR
ncbi:xanthine dehydrogenase family protein molybdopterin-binding subunit [Streptosporangium sp. 'caverna']|uniref:xanthine dehydrogenase family protein molybdopterin-binding subunit n=1 Tax=Streptosporangium sp. 'caverna' TaxID=2202249 RepID=UPI000D7DBADE|nr:xanthine dehydrogenase family protein molybdopterin-binding subunit [Streptosporangium sp. 'caverna']AWS42873.1 xanthine dehydrogenase [Streptosporangium sp. 'caverna']